VTRTGRAGTVGWADIGSQAARASAGKTAKTLKSLGKTDWSDMAKPPHQPCYVISDKSQHSSLDII
jgi:hypothetical protein